jgi:hypothetical protein
MQERKRDMSEDKRYFRVIAPGQHAVYFQETQQMEVPNPIMSYPEDHYMVREARWLFDEIGLATDAERITSVRVEDASARPGARRGGRPAK